jgi:uncharacterized coiled-coil protein SlyX
MAVEDRLARLEARQEALISSIHGLTDVMAQTRDLVTELMAWLQEPPSSDLADTLKALAVAVADQTKAIQAIGDQMIRLPSAVARAVTVGEVR